MIISIRSKYTHNCKSGKYISVVPSLIRNSIYNFFSQFNTKCNTKLFCLYMYREIFFNWLLWNYVSKSNKSNGTKRFEHIYKMLHLMLYRSLYLISTILMCFVWPMVFSIEITVLLIKTTTTNKNDSKCDTAANEKKNKHWIQPQTKWIKFQ